MSAWQDLVTASLIGTERAAVPVIPIPGAPPGAGALDRPRNPGRAVPAASRSLPVAPGPAAAYCGMRISRSVPS